MGDRLGTRGAVGILFSIFFKNFAFSGCKIRGPIVLALRRLFRFRALYINEWNFASELQLSSLSASLKPPCQYSSSFTKWQYHKLASLHSHTQQLLLLLLLKFNIHSFKYYSRMPNTIIIWSSWVYRMYTSTNIFWKDQFLKG